MPFLPPNQQRQSTEGIITKLSVLKKQSRFLAWSVHVQHPVPELRSVCVQDPVPELTSVQVSNQVDGMCAVSGT